MAFINLRLVSTITPSELVTLPYPNFSLITHCNVHYWGSSSFPSVRRWDPAPYWTESISPLSPCPSPMTAHKWSDQLCHCSIFFIYLYFRVKDQGSYLVLVLQPTSCCSWTRAASCFRSATSLPWACLMKGCSRRWVTDGRASKSFIRHLAITKIDDNFKHFRRTKPPTLSVFVFFQKKTVRPPEHCRELSCLDHFWQ